MLTAQMCLRAVDIQYDGLLRPWFGYIMARKVPGYWQCRSCCSVTQVDGFFSHALQCLPYFFSQVTWNQRELAIFFPHLFSECIMFFVLFFWRCVIFFLSPFSPCRPLNGLGLSYNHI